MIAAENMVGLLLCAGLSQRFGSSDKLLHLYRGLPLVQHAAATISALPFRAKVAVVPARGTPLQSLLIDLGFALEHNDAPEAGQDRSLRLGMQRAIEFTPEATLVCLGDMPLVPVEHLCALMMAAGPDRPAISVEGTVRSPPCVFPRIAAERLAGAECARGRDLLDEAADLALVTAAPGALTDFDTLADFESVA